MLANTRSKMVVGVWLLGFVVSVNAATVPFTEHFAGDAANWRNSDGTQVLTWAPNGGPDGSGYVTGTFNFVNSTAIDTPAIFRAQDEYGSSNLAFVGNWISDGVQSVCAYVRHDTGVPTSFFFRYASPANFPAAVSVLSPPVPSGQWTKVSITIPDPNFIFEGPFTFPQVFGNIGHLQIGVAVPPSLVGVDQVFNFALDQVRIGDDPACAPTVSAMGMLGMAGLLGLVGAGLVRRRRVCGGGDVG